MVVCRQSSLLLALLVLCSPAFAAQRHKWSHHAHHRHKGHSAKQSAHPSHAPDKLVEGEVTYGRYGHSAVYVRQLNKVLFIGGQVGDTSTYITNDVFSLDLDSVAPSSTNPVSSSALSHGLAPHAWAASAVDDIGQVWLIGGVTQDCSTDPLALILCPQKQTWTSASSKPANPPRRRQASALALPGHKNNAELYVWGGIAEPFTCSPTTLGYMGLDIWNTAGRGSVVTKAFERPKNVKADYMPPISDYAVVPWAEGQVLILGGQQADGTLASLCQVMVYLSETHTWEVKNASTTGVCPSPRMGHVAFRISDTQLLIHGGVGAHEEDNEDMWLLNGAPHGEWGWSKPQLSKESIKPPHRAWHTATWIHDNFIVLAYGIDTETTHTSGDIFYLKRNEDNDWTWSTKYRPASAPSVVPQPKSTTSIVPASVSTTPPEVGMGYNNGVTALAVPSSIVQAASDGGTATPLSDAQANVQSSGSTSKAVGGAVGGICGAAALLGLVGLYLRKRKTTRIDDNSMGGPVSSMHFSRPPPMRVLSLGKSMQQSPRSPLGNRAAPPSQMRATVDQSDLLDFLYPNTTKSNRSSESSERDDPFADGHAQENDHGLTSPPQSVSESVQSYPYLTALPMGANATNSTINANSRTALGLGRPSNRDQPEDGFTRLPSQSRYMSGARAASSPVGPRGANGRVFSEAGQQPPASPYVLGGPAGLLRVTNSPGRPSPARTLI